MSRLSLGVFTDSTLGSMIADWSSRARNVVFETDRHGFANLTAFIPMTLAEAFRIYEATPLAHVVLSDGAFTAFEGRLEDRRIIGGATEEGLEIGAYGYWRALSDFKTTTLWSTQQLDDVRTYTSDDHSAYVPERYQMDKKDRLFIALRGGENYATGTDVGSWVYFMPHQGTRNISEISFDYDVSLPTDYVADVAGINEDGTGINSEWTTTTSGSGSATVTLSTDKQGVMFRVYNNAGTVAYSGDTGDDYATWSDIRIKSSDNTNIYADEIIDVIATQVNSTNSTQLSDSTALIDSPAVDVIEANYQDMYPADIVQLLADLGDGTNLYEGRVWEDQVLRFQAEGTNVQSWYVDAASIQVDSTIDELYTAAYAVYRTTGGRIQRTSTNTDSAAESKYGVSRRTQVDTTTTDSTEAGNWRDTFVERHKDILPRAIITFDHLMTSSGAIVPGYLARSGDTVTIRNLPAGSGGVVDRIRTFRISRTRYDAERDELSLTPELELPSLEFMVAQSATILMRSGPNTKPGGGR